MKICDTPADQSNPTNPKTAQQLLTRLLLPFTPFDSATRHRIPYFIQFATWCAVLFTLRRGSRFHYYSLKNIIL